MKFLGLEGLRLFLLNANPCTPLQMSDMANWTTQDRHLRTDVLTLSGLSTDTVKAMGKGKVIFVPVLIINFSLNVRNSF